MTLAQVLYLTSVIENLNSIICIFVFFYIIGSAILAFVYGVMTVSGDEREGIEKFIKYYYGKLWIFIICLIITILTPSKNTMYLMLGATYLQQSNLPTKVSEVLDLKLDDVIKQLKEKK